MLDVTKKVRFLGRVAVRDGIIYLGNTGTGFEFETSARVSAIMTTKASTCQSDDKAAWLGVYTEGSDEPLRVIKLDAPEKEYLIREESEKSEKTRVFKLTEAAQAFVGIKGVYADGEVLPSDPREKKIEFIGDSLTCGYGNTASDATVPFRTCDENGYLAYAAVLARMLNADHNAVATSGIGLYSSWTGKDEKNDGSLMKDVYPYENTYVDGMLKRKAEKWDFSSFVPDLILVYLGTNDRTYIKYDPCARIDEFISAYAEFINYLREKNPSAHILCVYSALNDKPLDHDIYDAVEKMCYRFARMGDLRVSSFMLSPIDREKEGIGAQEHPTYLTHQRFARELYGHIKEKGIM